MEFTAQDWLEDFEKTANIAEQHGNPAGSSAGLNKAVARLDSGLKQIEKDPAAFRIDAREVQRRRGLVDGLKSQIGYKEPVYGGGTFVRPAGDMAPSTPMDRLAQQRMVAAEQDVLIDEIADGVDRLHDRAIMINEESTLHKSLLDDMDVDVDKATMGLRQQTKTANKIRQSTSNCYMYICIAVLFGILMLLLIISFQ
mmetsp:Transcript_4282/g.8926  ORF Transcript_4282/g.8926 Transcript_4282/m.8926 type:complete len:198 (+) Transcript_4282:131-724(+)